MKKFSIIMQLVFLLICSSVSLWAAEDRFDHGRIAAIKVLPYHFNPDQPLDAKVPAESEFQSDHHFGRQYTTSRKVPNEYNLGRAFSYLTLDEWAACQDDAIEYMKQVVAYDKEFNAGADARRNILLVRIRITATAETEDGGGASAAAAPVSSVHDYFFGVFVSGGQKYRWGEIRDLISISREPTLSRSLPEPLRKALEAKALRDLWSDASIRDPLKMYSLMRDDVQDAIPDEGSVEALLAEGVYSSPPFRLTSVGGDGVRKLAPFSNIVGDLEKTIGARLFGFPDKHPLNALFHAPKPAANSGERTLLDISRKREEAELNQEKLTQQLFGRPSYKDCGSLRACLVKKSDLEVCFNQAEQAFLSLLDGSFDADIGSLPHCHGINPLQRETSYRLEGIECDLYSLLDICRYCRGTFAHLLGSGKMLSQVASFLEKLKIKVNPTDHLRKEGMEIRAFSYHTTDI